MDAGGLWGAQELFFYFLFPSFFFQRGNKLFPALHRTNTSGCKAMCNSMHNIIICIVLYCISFRWSDGEIDWFRFELSPKLDGGPG